MARTVPAAKGPGKAISVKRYPRASSGIDSAHQGLEALSRRAVHRRMASTRPKLGSLPQSPARSAPAVRSDAAPGVLERRWVGQAGRGTVPTAPGRARTPAPGGAITGEQGSAPIEDRPSHRRGGRRARRGRRLPMSTARRHARTPRLPTRPARTGLAESARDSQTAGPGINSRFVARRTRPGGRQKRRHVGTRPSRAVPGRHRTSRNPVRSRSWRGPADAARGLRECQT